MDARLAFAVELEQRDATVAGRIDVLAETSAEVEQIRARAAEIALLLDALPAERAHLHEATAEAALALEPAKAGLTEAETALERARGEDARALARATITRAAATMRAEDERRDRLAARRSALELEAEQLTAEAVDLEKQAKEVAAQLEESSRVSPMAPPQPGLSGIVEWGSRAHAAVLVARGGLDLERDRIVREANELASVALGEPLYATSVTLVRRRLEEELA